MRSAKLLLGLTLALTYPAPGSGEEPGATVEASASGCRVLINFEGQSVDPASGKPDWRLALVRLAESRGWI